MCLVRCKAHTQNLGPGGPQESLDLIWSSELLQTAKILTSIIIKSEMDHCKIYIKVRPPLAHHFCVVVYIWDIFGTFTMMPTLVFMDRTLGFVQ